MSSDCPGTYAAVRVDRHGAAHVTASPDLRPLLDTLVPLPTDGCCSCSSSSPKEAAFALQDRENAPDNRCPGNAHVPSARFTLGTLFAALELRGLALVSTDDADAYVADEDCVWRGLFAR